jgi:hypothetical protein
MQARGVEPVDPFQRRELTTPDHVATYVKSATHRRFGALAGEVAIDQVGRVLRALTRDRGAQRLAAHDALQAMGAH